jgi:hypothetical protein
MTAGGEKDSCSQCRLVQVQFFYGTDGPHHLLASVIIFTIEWVTYFLSIVHLHRVIPDQNYFFGVKI